MSEAETTTSAEETVITLEKQRKIARNRHRNDVVRTTRWLKQHRHKLQADRNSTISAQKDARRKLRREQNDAAGIVPSSGVMKRQKDGVLDFKDTPRGRQKAAQERILNEVLTDDGKVANLVKELGAFQEINAQVDEDGAG